MSTAQRELEELRRVREAERLRQVQEDRINAEKAAERARKEAFLARAKSFEQKKGPTDEEIKQIVTKESQKRKFGRELNRTLAQDPNKNAFATEIRLKNKYDGVDDSEYYNNGGGNMRMGDWEYVEQYGGPAYYWNRVTNQMSYDMPAELERMFDEGDITTGDSATGGTVPPPKPPPPPMKLPGMDPPPPVSREAAKTSAPPAPPPPPPPPPPPAPPAEPTGQDKAEYRKTVFAERRNSALTSRRKSVLAESSDPTGSGSDANSLEAAATAAMASYPNYPWTYVWENEEYPYYWNMDTNETTFDQPEGYVHEAYNDFTSLLWRVDLMEVSGEYQYINLSTGQVRFDKPYGTPGVVLVNSDGVEETWYQYTQQESDPPIDGYAVGDTYYYNASTGEVRPDAPVGGYEIIAESDPQ